MVSLQSPVRRTSNQHAFEALLSAIVDGTLVPGSTLRLKELSEQLGMSMMPVREAIRQLEALGVVENPPHRGARVLAVSPGDLLDTYRTRILLEGELCKLAASNFDAIHASKAQLALDRQRGYLEAGDVNGAREAHRDFHFTIYDAAGSTWLMRAVAPTWANSERYRMATMVTDDVLTKRRAEHEALLAACVGRDPVAAQELLRIHLLSTVQHIDTDVAVELSSTMGLKRSRR